jgi:hypothetical protein
MFQESFYMFKTLDNNKWTCGFFFKYKSFFFLIKCSPNHLNFFGELQYIPQEGIHVFKTFKNKNTYTLLNFNTQTSLSTSIILNL